MKLVKLLLFLVYSINVISCSKFDGATCILKKDKIYIYGGMDKKRNLNKNIYSIELEGLKLRAQKSEWKLEKVIENMRMISGTQSFSINEKSNEVLNFGGLYFDGFVFNWLDIVTYKIRNETKGLNQLMKILNRPNGLGKHDNFQYKFIQSDIEPSKFYLLDSLLQDLKSEDKEKYFNILIYDALKNTWKDTKLLFYTDSDSIIVTYNDLIYVIKTPEDNLESSFNYIINIKKSKIIKFIPKGDIPLMNKHDEYLINKNQLYYFISDEKGFIFNFYIFNLDTLIWKKQNFESIGNHLAYCMTYYKGYIIFTLGGYGYDANYTQIFDTKTWTKVSSINTHNKDNELKIFNDQVITNHDQNNNEKNKEKQGINKSALIAGLVSSGIFIGLTIIFVYFCFKRRREANKLKPPEFITEHEIINVLDKERNEKSLSFRFSVKSNISNISKIPYAYVLQQPRVTRSIDDEVISVLDRSK